MTRHSLVFALALLAPLAARSQTLTPDQVEARAIFQQLIDINTSYKEGSTAPAAHASRATLSRCRIPRRRRARARPRRRQGLERRRAHAGLVEDAQADSPDRAFSTSSKRCAPTGRWIRTSFSSATASFTDAARATSRAARTTLVESLLRLKREHILPERTLILALTAGEEGGGGYNGISWLIDNHRDLIDAEWCLNTDGGDPLIKNGKRMLRAVQASEKLYQSYYLTVTNKGGHSSMPPTDNAIATLAAAIGREWRFHFPVHL